MSEKLRLDALAVRDAVEDVDLPNTNGGKSRIIFLSQIAADGRIPGRQDRSKNDANLGDVCTRSTTSATTFSSCSTSSATTRSARISFTAS